MSTSTRTGSSRDERATQPEQGPARVVALFPATKFLPPPARSEHVRRGRCLDLTADALAGQHVLVSASAGAGKSTFAAQWAAGIGATAWVSFAADDDAPGQLWAAVITALKTVSRGLGNEALPALLGGADTRSVLVRLVGDLMSFGSPLALVLDDVHLVTAAECQRELEWLLINAPSNVRICLCTRVDPPIRIPRLVARGLLSEVRNAELGFDQAETYEFIHDRLAIDIDRATADELGRRVEGWAAGLYLAALSLRAGTPPDQLLSVLESGDRRVRDYVSNELLARLGDSTRRLLESLALMPRFCAELCTEVLGEPDMRARLAELDASNLFVIPLDRTGRWFRLHHLIAKVLAERAVARDRAGVQELHRRAGRWHRAQGDVGEAIHHFVDAGDYEDAADLIAASIPVQINVARLAGTLAHWLTLLPEELVCSRASLCLAHGWVAAINSRRAEAQVWLERAAALPHTGPLPSGAASAAAEAALIQATFCFKDYQAGRRHSEDALRLESRDSPWQPLVQLMYGWYAYHDGRLDTALAAYERSELLATRDVQIASLVIAPAIAALVHLERGNLAAADAAGRRSDDARRAAGVEAVPQMLNSWFGTARVHRELGRLEQASRHAEFAARIAADYPPENDSLLIAVPLTIELARIRCARGDRSGAEAALEDARRRLRGVTDAGRISDWFAEAERELAAATAAPFESSELSPRELTVLRLLAGSGTLRELSEELFVSQNTLKTHCRVIYRKLGVSSREQAVSRARELSLIG
jgi:LuxR family maltose regulon positive regulatory protein